MLSLAARYRALTRNRAWLPFAVGGTLLVACWLLVPSLYKPYVRVPSNKLDFALDCLPESVQIEVPSAFAVARQAQVSVLAPGSETPSRTVPFRTVKVTSDGGSQILALSLLPEQLTALGQLSAALKGPPSFLYTLLFDRTPYVDVRRVELGATAPGARKCLESDLGGRELAQAVRHPSARLMRFKLMQDELSDLVLAFNNSLANVLLAAMVVALLWLAYLWVAAAKRLYVSKDVPLRREFMGFFENAPAELRGRGPSAVVELQFHAQNRRFVFAKTMGPALGFLLTVSSLSAALHPSVQGTQDTFRFVSGIQIAIIATFVGLAIRIVAQFAQRLHRDLAERVLLLIEQEPTQKGDPQHAS